MKNNIKQRKYFQLKYKIKKIKFRSNGDNTYYLKFDFFKGLFDIKSKNNE